MNNRQAISKLVREDIIDRSEAKIAKRIVKGKIKSQEDLNCLLDSIDDVTDLQDIEDFIYDILYWSWGLYGNI